MKPHLPGGRPRGFSLFELMAVIAIIVGLTALVIGTLGPVKARVARIRCDTLMQRLETGLKGYASEYGGYPINTDIESGGRVLFKTMTGDLDEDGAPDTHIDEHIHIFVKDLVPPLDTDRKPKKDDQGEPIGRPDAKMIQGQWMVVDPWGNKVYYMNWKRGDTAKGGSTPGGGGGRHNPTYDLWSMTDDESGQNEAKWVKNW